MQAFFNIKLRAMKQNLHQQDAVPGLMDGVEDVDDMCRRGSRLTPTHQIAGCGGGCRILITMPANQVDGQVDGPDCSSFGELRSQVCRRQVREPGAV
jgi:hypothetical protein